MAEATTARTSSNKEEDTQPVVLDLGKRKKKQVKALRRGDGPLLADVLESIDQLKLAGQVDKNAQPVIVVVRERRRRGNLMW